MPNGGFIMSESNFAFDVVEVGNRTARPLSVQYDGKQWVLPPYPATKELPKVVADKALQQHVRMGTEDPFNPKSFDSLVYVKGWKNSQHEPWPDTPIEQSKAIERIDRSLCDPDRQEAEVLSFGRMPPEKMTNGVGAIFKGDGVSDET